MAKRKSESSVAGHGQTEEVPQQPVLLENDVPQHRTLAEQRFSFGGPQRVDTPDCRSSNVDRQDLFSMAQDLEASNADDEPLDTQRSAILRVDREVLVHKSTAGKLQYVVGTFSDLNCAALEGLARAIGSLLPRVLSVEPGEVKVRCGFLIGPVTLCPAAQFSMSGQAQASIDQDTLLDAIQRCVNQLKDPALWDHTQPIDANDVQQTSQLGDPPALPGWQ